MRNAFLNPWFQTLNTLRRVQGTRSQFIRVCPICDYQGRFGVQVQPIRVDSVCPNCKSLGRHRYFFHLLKIGELKIQGPIIHFAAEPCLSRFLQGVDGQYKQVGPTGSDLILDIENIAIDAESVGTVIAHHVLEHVNDTAALTEIWRVLKQGGIFCFTTPVVESWASTFEDPQISGNRQRLLYFGQQDHLRIYGRDLRDKLREVGFKVQEFVASEPEVSRYSLERGESVFVCMK